jgi:hypothetical protein
VVVVPAVAAEVPASRVAVRVWTMQLSGVGVVEGNARVTVTGVPKTIAVGGLVVGFVVVPELEPSVQYIEYVTRMYWSAVAALSEVSSVTRA